MKYNARVKSPYEIAVCPVCNEGLLYVGWEPDFFCTDEVGFTYLPVTMDERHEAHVIAWCPACRARLRIVYKYLRVEHQKDDAADDIYFNWETRKHDNPN